MNEGLALFMRITRHAASGLNGMFLGVGQTLICSQYTIGSKLPESSSLSTFQQEVNRHGKVKSALEIAGTFIILAVLFSQVSFWRLLK